MIKTVVYHGENQLGEVEIFLQQNNDNLNLNSNPILLLMREKGIRITHFSPPSERCSPLAVLYTVAADSGFCFKMEPSNKFLHSRDEPTQLSALHAACLGDNKTAVMSLGEVELHLVAMPSRNTSRVPCFWGFAAGIGLYSSCLDLLNLRCLGIVFDLDETLIVANTMRSFEDRIDALQRKMSSEADPQRLAGMVAEVKRYQEDRAILKQYAENDQVIDNGKVLKVQHEVVPALSDNHPSVVRPLIRLPDRNTVLTRINPSIRDTSVLVRLRPAWEDLRSYLTARGRKRFEVYVCTMAERDYALEMWRLLDPDSNLIITSELLDRIVCVKSGFKKSLFNVFHHGNCHPKMALVIDDRLKVWEEKDQSRVHVVPAFAPYYAPLAEANNTIPVLCVARNVACNVRGGFFKDFDDGLLVQISEVLYEDELKNMPCPPDVSNYLVSEDDASIINGNKEPPLTFDGMAGEEVERRLKEAISAAVVSVASYALPVDPNPRVPSGASYPMPVDPNPRIPSVEFTIASPIPVMPAEPAASFPSNQFQQAPTMVRHIGHTGPAEPTLQSSPVREEGEVPESELDPDTRRRLLILQHGMDNTRENVPGEPQFSGRSPVQAPAPGPLPVPTGPAPVPVPVPLPAPPPPPCPASVPMGQSRGHWYEGQMNPGQPGGPMPKEFSLSTDGARLDKQRPVAPPFSRKMDSFNRSERPFVLKARFLKDAQAQRRDERFRSNSSRHSQSYQDEDVPLCRSSSGIDYESESGRLSSTKEDWGSDSGQSSSSGKFFDSEAGQGIPWSETPAGALHDIAVKCGAKVEYSSTLAATTELKFLIEVSFAGQRVGQGSGKTRREAQQKGAEAALRSLADKYLSHLKSDSSITKADANKASNANDNGFFGESNSREISDEPLSGGDRKSQELLSDGSMRSLSSVTALRELCSMEGLGLDIVHQPVSGSAFQKDETCVQVEIDGQVFGRGVGLTWDEAQYQAVEKALAGLRSMLDHTTYKRPGSPRALQGSYGKRMRSDYPRGSFQRMPSSRYPRNASPVP